VDGAAADIVYTDHFSGVPGSYLRPSVTKAGYDPDKLDPAHRATMDISGEGKAWRDIWSAGQGIGAIDSVVPAADLVARLGREYAAAKARLA
jgi:nitronate monooxygenase